MRQAIAARPAHLGEPNVAAVGVSRVCVVASLPRRPAFADVPGADPSRAVVQPVVGLQPVEHPGTRALGHDPEVRPPSGTWRIRPNALVDTEP